MHQRQSRKSEAPTALYLHGKPREKTYYSPSVLFPHVAGWIGASATRLRALGYEVWQPAVRQPYLARAVDFEAALDGFPIDERSILVGFSCGASTIDRALAKQPELRPGLVVLVSYWRDLIDKYEGSEGDYVSDSSLPDRCGSLKIIHNPEDIPVRDSIAVLPTSWTDHDRVEFIDVPKEYGHMLPYDMPELPELNALLPSEPVLLR